METRLIVALDFTNLHEALSLIDKLDPRTCGLKIGLEMFTLFGANFVRELVKKGFKVFLDLKFYDIPNTVAQACKACAELGVWMMNLHASGGLKMMQAAKNSLEPYGAERPLLIAVTVLTSMDQLDLNTLGIETPLADHANHLALLAHKAQLDGVVCSAYEVPLIKATCGASFLTVTPGIRLAGDEKNDQKRVMTPMQASALGADYLVVGRSITAATNPTKVVEEILLNLDTAGKDKATT